MPRLRMRGATYSIDHGGRLAAGQLVDVEPEVARRWLRDGIAADEDDPDAKAALTRSADAMQAEIARLQNELARAQAGRPDETGPSLPDSPYDQHDELAGFDFLSEQQRTNLQRAGFSTLAQIRDASDDELSEIDRVGAQTIVRLREAARAGDTPPAPSVPRPLNPPGR